MYQMICPDLEVFQAMEGLDASDGAGTGRQGRADDIRAVSGRLWGSASEPDWLSRYGGSYFFGYMLSGTFHGRAGHVEYGCCAFFSRVAREREWGPMHLTVREEERIQIWAAAEMARRRLERGVKLNYPEAIALICDELLERAREGSIPMLTDLMEYGATILKRDDVMTGVPEMMKVVQVEALFPDGTKLVTVMNPIRE